MHGAKVHDVSYCDSVKEMAMKNKWWVSMLVVCASCVPECGARCGGSNRQDEEPAGCTGKDTAACGAEPALEEVLPVGQSQERESPVPTPITPPQGAQDTTRGASLESTTPAGDPRKGAVH